MAINNRQLTQVQNDVTSPTTTEGRFRSGVNDTLTQVNATQELLGTNVDNADIEKLAAVTATAAELNYLDNNDLAASDIQKLADITTSAGDLNRVSGYTGNSADLNILTGAAAADITATEFRNINGLTVTGTAISGFISNLDQTPAASANNLDRVNGFTGTGTDLNRATQLDDAGNGVAGQVLTSDGDGTYSWSTPSSFTWNLTDGDGTSVSVDTDTVTISEGTGIDVNFTDTTDPNFTMRLTNTDRGSQQNIFKNVAVVGQLPIVADSNNDTLNVAGGTGIIVDTDASNDTLTFTNSDRGSSQNIFKRVSGNTGTATADNNNDTLTIAGGSGIRTVASSSSDTITINLDISEGLSAATIANADLIAFSDEGASGDPTRVITFANLRTSLLSANSVGTTQIANDAVTNAKIATNAVNADSIAANAVGTSEIANDAVTNAQIATNAVNSDSIAANAVGSSEIATNAVGASEIAANAVGASELNVSGNGNTSQYLRSDGDGSFSWATPVGVFTPSVGSGQVSQTDFIWESRTFGQSFENTRSFTVGAGEVWLLLSSIGASGSNLFFTNNNSTRLTPNGFVGPGTYWFRGMSTVGTDNDVRRSVTFQAWRVR